MELPSAPSPGPLTELAPDLPPPEAPEASEAGEPAAPTPPRRVASPRAVKVKEPPLTGREIFQYVVLFAIGVAVTAGTIWFYSLFS